MIYILQPETVLEKKRISNFMDFLPEQKKQINRREKKKTPINRLTENDFDFCSLELRKCSMFISENEDIMRF